MALRPQGTTRRKSFKHGTTKPGSNLSHFPLLLKLTSDADLGAMGVTAGNGIKATQSDGTTSAAWGKVAASLASSQLTLTAYAESYPLSGASTGDPIGYLCYGKVDTDYQAKTGVPDSNTTVFAPLEEDPGGSSPQFQNWHGSNDLIANHVSGADSSTAGVVGNGVTLNSDYITESGSGGSYWQGADRNVQQVSLVCCLVDDGTHYGGHNLNDGNYQLYADWRAGTAHFGALGYDVTASAGSGSHHFAVTFDHGTVKGYLDGSLVGTGTATNTDVGYAPAVLAGYIPAVSYGTLTEDELRVHNGVVLTADWIAYDAANKLNWSSTVTWGSEEAYCNYGATANSGYKTASSNYTFSQTCVSDDSVLVVAISVVGSNTQVNYVKYNGVSLTRKIGSQASGGSATSTNAELWYLVNPASGSHNVEVDFNGTSCDSVATAICMSGCDVITPVEGTANASVGTGTSDADVQQGTSNDGEFVIGVIACQDTSITASHDSLSNVSGTNGSHCVDVRGYVATNASPGYHVGATGVASGKEWSVAAIAVRPKSASAPPGSIPNIVYIKSQAVIRGSFY